MPTKEIDPFFKNIFAESGIGDEPNPALEIILNAMRLVESYKKPKQCDKRHAEEPNDIALIENNPEDWAIETYDSAIRSVKAASVLKSNGEDVHRIFCGHFVLENDFHAQALNIFLSKLGHEEHINPDDLSDYNQLINDTKIPVDSGFLSMEVFRLTATEDNEMGDVYAVSFFAEAV